MLLVLVDSFKPCQRDAGRLLRAARRGAFAALLHAWLSLADRHDHASRYIAP
jgi:hypothetical protein